MYNDVKLSKLQAAFPRLGITLGYIGNSSGTPGTPAYRDDRCWMVFTTMFGHDGKRISLYLDWREMSVEQLRRAVMLRIASDFMLRVEANDYTIMRRAVLEPHWRRIEWKPEALDIRGAPYSDVLPEEIILYVRKEVLRELVLCEEGAYEDALHSNTGRPLHAHVYKIAQRYKARLVIRTYAEAEDAYYAVCSGTFSSRSRACFNAAVRIAITLRGFASPETVKRFPMGGIEAP